MVKLVLTNADTGARSDAGPFESVRITYASTVSTPDEDLLHFEDGFWRVVFDDGDESRYSEVEIRQA